MPVNITVPVAPLQSNIIEPLEEIEVTTKFSGDPGFVSPKFAVIQAFVPNVFPAKAVNILLVAVPAVIAAFPAINLKLPVVTPPPPS